MDTSREYALMCKNATLEIQNKKLPISGFCNFETGDVFLHTIDGGIFLLVEGELKPKIEETIWLPRLDQLIELYSNTMFSRNPKHKITILCDNMRNLVETYNSSGARKGIFDSFEKLFLDFFMRQFSKKRWCPELGEWLREDEHLMLIEGKYMKSVIGNETQFSGM